MAKIDIDIISGHELATFEMRNRPRKPREPKPIYEELGCSISVLDLEKKIEDLKTKYPDVSADTFQLCVDYGWDGELGVIQIHVPPASWSVYEANMEKYRDDLKDYNAWRKKHKRQIDDWKAKEKKATAKRKLERTQERLQKELADVENKLNKEE